MSEYAVVWTIRQVRPFFRATRSSRTMYSSMFCILAHLYYWPKGSLGEECEHNPKVHPVSARTTHEILLQAALSEGLPPLCSLVKVRVFVER